MLEAIPHITYHYIKILLICTEFLIWILGDVLTGTQHGYGR